MSELVIGIPGTPEEWMISLLVTVCIIYAGSKIL
jgi:hypothetical protein